jgi:hypothetical protein
MIRDDVTADAANDFMLDTPNPFHQEPVMQFRDSSGAQTNDTDNHFTATTPNVPTPMWLRLDRVGNTFTGYWAVDNNGTPGPWNLMTTHTTVMPTTVYVGLALTAHNNGNLASATFDHVTITGATAPLPPPAARLTDGGGTEAGAVFETSRVGVANFNSSFTFRLHDGTNPMADGVAFVIQGSSPTALGGTGGGLGYGSDHPGGPQGIPNSVAIKFDLFNNAGEGTDSTGIFFNGDSPTIPTASGEASIDLSGTGIDLHSQDVFNVTLGYDGSTLTQTITDTSTGASFSHAYTVNIAALVGGNVGYAGFTGGTGGLTTVADVQTWTYQFTSAATTEAAAGGSGPFSVGQAAALLLPPDDRNRFPLDSVQAPTGPGDGQRANPPQGLAQAVVPARRDGLLATPGGTRLTALSGSDRREIIDRLFGTPTDFELF